MYHQLQLLSMLTSSTNTHPFLPVVVGTQKDSMYDALLSFLSQRATASQNPSISNEYDMIRSWLISHHGQLSASSLEEILFWLLHSQIGTQTAAVDDNFDADWINS